MNIYIVLVIIGFVVGISCILLFFVVRGIASLDSDLGKIHEVCKVQFETLSSQIHNLSNTTEMRLNNMTNMLDDKLFRIQSDSAEKLERIRLTVEEKLQESIETKLGQTFNMVSERLEQMHRGIGEMQALANGVGDLKRILSNVKTRGVWAEAHLEAVLQQLLNSGQYMKNIAVREGSLEKVEFVVMLPTANSEESILLPIDAKFPLDVYQRMVSILESGGKEEDIKNASKELEVAIKKQAKIISEKYVNPPRTTEFAIMFLPIEGLYAEVLRTAGLAEKVQSEYKILITGPSTLAAILSSLQIGYRAVAIQKHSSEIWNLLSVVRKEFVKFGDILNKTKLKLDQASQVIGDAQSKTRTIQRHLRYIDTIESGEAERGWLGAQYPNSTDDED